MIEEKELVQFLFFLSFNSLQRIFTNIMWFGNIFFHYFLKKMKIL